MQGFAKKLIEAHLLSERDDENSLEKGCALIRANLNVDTDEIKDYDSWAELYAQAIWIENFRLKRIAELMANLFGKTK